MWNLVIVDEAHRMSTRDAEHKTERYWLGELLSEQTEHLVLLTGTPHRGDQDAFCLFLRLLDPGLRIVDIVAMSRITHAHGAMLCIDGTFASPALQRPLELGADIVMHSSTKFLGGHSDVLGGVVATSDDALAEQLRFSQKAVGAVPSPFDCWLLLRGVKTLQLRVERQSDSALRIARCLAQHPAVRAVHYPGLETHLGHELAARQMSGRFGGVVSFELADQAAAVRMLERLRVIALAESPGAVESLAGLPAIMTHASMPPEVRARIGVSDALIRLAIGIEDVDDLIEDLQQALESAASS